MDWNTRICFIFGVLLLIYYTSAQDSFNHTFHEEKTLLINGSSWPKSGEFLLIAQKRSINRYDFTEKTIQALPLKNISSAIALDFDTKNNCIYWSDVALDQINKQCPGNSEHEILESNNLGVVEGIALDWISHNLYFVDRYRKTIEVVRIDKKIRKTLLDDQVLQKPRGIAVHPPLGYFFWTDWGKPEINRAHLDGSNVKNLFGQSKLDWPNGITIDFTFNKIYWTDAYKNYIGSSDLDGSHFKMVLSNSNEVRHPFAVAILKNRMYWNDWRNMAIFSADKETGEGVEDVLSNQTVRMFDMKAFGETLEGSNGCVNATCDFICVGLPEGRWRCLTPE